MVAAHRPKSPDKHDVCRKVTARLKKVYAASPPRELPVLETLLYAICLEDVSPEQADTVYARLLNAFHDLNEARVSSISELQAVFADMPDPQWRSLRVKNALQHVFETCYAFDFESLRRKTADLAVKQLGRIHGLSPFVRNYVMQHCLGSHVLPIDAKTHAALVWLGLAERENTPEHAGESLRSFVRKADAPLFCHLIHCLASDSRRNRVFAAALARPDQVDASADPIARLEQLLRRRDAGPVRARRNKSAPAKGSREGRAARTRVGTKKRH